MVHRAIEQLCSFRGWSAHAINVRTNHVHVVVSAEARAETITSQMKSYATRAPRTAGMKRRLDQARQHAVPIPRSGRRAIRELRSPLAVTVEDGVGTGDYRLGHPLAGGLTPRGSVTARPHLRTRHSDTHSPSRIIPATPSERTAMDQTAARARDVRRALVTATPRGAAPHTWNPDCHGGDVPGAEPPSHGTGSGPPGPLRPRGACSPRSSGYARA